MVKVFNHSALSWASCIALFPITLALTSPAKGPLRPIMNIHVAEPDGGLDLLPYKSKRNHADLAHLEEEEFEQRELQTTMMFVEARCTNVHEWKLPVTMNQCANRFHNLVPRLSARLRLSKVCAGTNCCTPCLDLCGFDRREEGAALTMVRGS